VISDTPHKENALSRGSVKAGITVCAPQLKSALRCKYYRFDPVSLTRSETAIGVGIDRCAEGPASNSVVIEDMTRDAAR
jgi:hypothetical protein